MQAPVDNALAALSDRVGSVDDFVSDKLDMKPGQLEQYFSAEQVDALGLAIDNIERGAGFIIGDQTGIGKGRVNAGIIRYAIVQGRTPIFVTEKDLLYGDMYRDLMDIGLDEMLGRDPRILMTDANKTVPLSEDSSKTLKTGTAATHNALLAKIAADRSLGDFDMLFTTYSQMQTVKGEATQRQALLSALAPNAVVMFDESHNAGGAGANDFIPKKAGAALNRAEFARKIIAESAGAFYSSATFAKRPDVMDLYSKTDMAKAVPSIERLAPAIAQGGVPMQQAVSAMLAEAGQYLRRERSFEGIVYDAPLVDVDVESYDQFSQALHAVNLLSKEVEKAAKVLDKDLKADAKMISRDGATGSAGASSTNFGSIMHNLINQMLLAIKAPISADRAIARLKAGEKPVIALANTMESFLSEFAEENDIGVGDAISLNFKDLLRRYLERSRILTIRRPFMGKGEKAEKKYLSDEQLGPAGLAAYKSALQIIEKSNIDELPISPIDAIIAKIEGAGYKVGEITGRSLRIDYGAAVPTLRMRDKDATTTTGKRAAIRRFNGGQIDAIILNRSGSTGLSLHAGEKFKDQRKRHMILAQAEGNIDTHMQMLGRVSRTGQVVLPSYEQLVANIPAEKRPAAVLAKKMASLNASTTAARGGALTADSTPDFMNEVGDRIVAELMNENPSLHKRLGSPVGEDAEGAMRKVTGRIPLLRVKEQEALYALIEETYRSVIAEMEAAGQNVLEAKRLELDAVPVSSKELQPGTGPSPFQRAVVAETFDVKKQSKPYKFEDVAGAIKTALKSDTDISDPLAAIENLAKAGAVATAARAGAALKDFAVYRKDYVSDIEGDQHLEAARTKLDAMEKRFERIIHNAPVGSRVTVRSAEEAFTGIVVEIKKNGQTQNPLALGSWRLSVAVPGHGVMHFSFSRIDTMADPNASSDEMQIAKSWESFTALAKLFDESAKSAREKRIILTGNILSAYDFTDRKGQIITFTTRDGDVRQGILMPASMKEVADVVKTKGAPLGTLENVMAELQKAGRVATPDGVVVTLSRHGEMMVSVPASKARGGKYYLNPAVTALLAKTYDELYKRGSDMRGTISPSIQRPIVEALMNAGAMFEKPFELTPDKPAPAPAPSPKPEWMTQRNAGLTARAVASGLDRQHIADVVNAIVNRVVGERRVAVRVKDDLRIPAESSASVGGLSGAAEGLFTISDVRPMIEIAFSAADPANTTHHEAFHALQHIGVFHAQEIAVFKREAWRLRRELTRLYGDAALHFSQIEAEAGAYGYYAAARDAGKAVSNLHIGARRYLERLYEIFRRVRNYFAGLGFQTSEDIFERARTGAYSRSGLSRFERRDENAPAPMARPRLVENERSVMSRIVSYWADSATRMKELQDRLSDETGKAAADVHGALGALNTRVSERIETMVRNEMAPMLEAVAEAGGQARVDRYLYVRHAPERNAYIASINPAMPDGGSGIDTATAERELAAFEAGPDADKLMKAAALVDRINGADLDEREAAGLLSEENVKSLSDAYKHYVPLRGFADGDFVDGGAGGGQGISVATGETKASKGRKSEAESPIAQTVAKRIEGIERAQENRVARRLVQLGNQMQAHYGEADSPMRVRRTLPNTRVVRTDQSGAKVVSEVTDKNYPFSPDVVTAKVGGKAIYVELRGENQLVDAIKNALNEKNDGGMAKVAAATQFYAKLRTAWNVFFAPKNFVRDTEDAMIATAAMLGPRGIVAYGRALPASLKASARYVVLGKTSPAFEQFRHAGGKMSWAKLRTIDDVRRDVDRALNGVNPALRAGLAIKAVVEGWNDLFENAQRFALFSAALDMGKPLDFAAKLALEGTLNFHRRGHGDLLRVARAIFPFINPSIQAPLRASRLIKQAAGPDMNSARGVAAIVKTIGGVARTYAALVPLGFAIALINYLVGGDDDDGIPFFDKAQADYRDDRNIIIYTGGKDEKGKPNAIIVPAFPEIMFPYKFGAGIAAAIFGKRGVGEIGADVGKAAYMLSPTEGRGVVPALFQPAYDIKMNKNWAGSQIHKTPQYGQKGVPNSEIAFNSTPQTWREIARGLYQGTNGIINLHPEDVRHIVRELVGGYYAPSSWLAGQAGVGDTDTRLPPLARDFYARGGDLHQGFERKKFGEMEEAANKKRNQLQQKFDDPTLPNRERQAQRVRHRDDIEKDGGVVGPRGGISTIHNEIFSTGRMELSALYKQLDKVRSDPVKSAAVRQQISDTQKRYRILATDAKSGKIDAATVLAQMRAKKAELRAAAR